MSKQVNDLKARVEWLEGELAAKMDSADRMFNELQTYRNREKAIVAALTEAQNSSARIIDEANEKAAAIIAAANEDAAFQSEKMQLALEDANLRADAIIKAAQEKAAMIYGDAEQLLQERRGELSKLNRRINDVAKYASDMCRSFAESMADSIADDANDTVIDSVPEEYATTKELMQSIYALEGREIPFEEATEAVQDEAPANELSEDELSDLLDEVAQAPSEEEKLWTVDEVPETDADMMDDAELDAVLNDILKDD